ncbi:MAG: hypothetical protein MJY87_10985 [Fibrobacter sp.]|nr:hypothetical protein [Fibrobacter sp.]
MDKTKIKNIVLRVEIIIGIISMIFGAVLTIMVWGEGYYIGALMLVITGLISVFLGAKELIAPMDNMLQWLPLFYIVVRRTFFFLNLVLCALVIGTMGNLL